MKIIEHKFRICDQLNISIPQVPSFPSSQFIHYHLEAIANWISKMQDQEETIPIIIESGILF